MPVAWLFIKFTRPSTRQTLSSPQTGKAKSFSGRNQSLEYLASDTCKRVVSLQTRTPKRLESRSSPKLSYNRSLTKSLVAARASPLICILDVPSISTLPLSLRLTSARRHLGPLFSRGRKTG
ncbi:hypothetical protein EVAR_42590_1 [Eumeta japonica]|uniref:Uncharacterized protein n=1 Tax=Eumeta variegata TaxID=151549 RepID=A0A4C1XND4_EUMVA|nr:hypothetical protein EVAR_42590_1 [Eumeta japonica]